MQKLRGIPDVPPQRVTNLETARRQLRQLSCILDIAQFLPATKLVKRKKLLLLMLRGKSWSLCPWRSPLERDTRCIFAAGCLMPDLVPGSTSLN